MKLTFSLIYPYKNRQKCQLYKRQLFEIVHYQQAQPAITCSKLIIETLEQGVKYVQS